MGDIRNLGLNDNRAQGGWSKDMLDPFTPSLPAYNPGRPNLAGQKQSGIRNRFDSFFVPSKETERGILDKLFNTNLDALNRNYGSDAATIQRQATERMASQGVNKGSFFNNMVNNSTDNLNESKYNALSGLLSNKLGQDVNVYDKFWNRLFAKTKAAQSTDFGIEDYKLKNKQYELQKRLTDDKLNQSPGFLDDIFSALGLGAQIAGIPAGAEGESILQLLLAL